MNSRRVLIFILLICVLGGGRVVYAQDDATPPAPPPAGPSAAPLDPVAIDSAVRDLHILAGTSAIVEVGSPITRVSLTSADIADALVTSPSQLLGHAKAPGRISMFVWDRAGSIQRYEIAVQRDLERLTADVKQLIPGEPIDVRGNGKFVILSGTVSTKALAERAVSLASGFVGAPAEVVSLLQVQPSPPTPQVLLQVRFAEVSRAALTELGLSLFTSPIGVKNTIGRVTTQQFAAPGFVEQEWTKESFDFGADVTSAKGKFTFSDFLNFFVFSQKYDLGAMIRAMQQQGV